MTCPSKITMESGRYECDLDAGHEKAHQTEGQAQMWTNEAQDGGEWSEHDSDGTKRPPKDDDRLTGFLWFVSGAMHLRTDDLESPTEEDMRETVRLYLEAEARGDLE